MPVAAATAYTSVGYGRAAYYSVQAEDFASAIAYAGDSLLSGLIASNLASNAVRSILAAQEGSSARIQAGFAYDDAC